MSQPDYDEFERRYNTAKSSKSDRAKSFPYNIQSVYLHNCLKILAFLLSTKSNSVTTTTTAPETAVLLAGDLHNGEVSEEPHAFSPNTDILCDVGE